MDGEGVEDIADFLDALRHDPFELRQGRGREEGRHVVGVHGTRVAATFTPAAGVAERADRSSTGAGAVSISVTRPVTATGATGTTTTTATAAGVYALITVALRPLVTVETHRYVNSGVTRR